MRAGEILNRSHTHTHEKSCLKFKKVCNVLTERSGDSITGRSDEGHTGRSGGYILRKMLFEFNFRALYL